MHEAIGMGVHLIEVKVFSTIRQHFTAITQKLWNPLFINRSHYQTYVMLLCVRFVNECSFVFTIFMRFFFSLFFFFSWEPLGEATSSNLCYHLIGDWIIQYDCFWYKYQTKNALISCHNDSENYRMFCMNAFLLWMNFCFEWIFENQKIASKYFPPQMM